jgi:signal transduction histidine kinase
MLLCTLLATGALWALYLYRLKLATEQIQQRLGAKMEERERIARELHDTLLQGFQGLMLRFQAVIGTLPKDGHAYQLMEKALDRGDDVLLEGRERVRELRAEGVTGQDLPDALTSWGEELAQGYTAGFSIEIVGSPRILNPIVCNEAYRIAQEALSNAFQHSHGTKIEAELTYAGDHVSLRVRDDGKGIREDLLSSGRTGHWGLSGMRERAQKIGAELTFWSSEGSGTEVDLTIPSRIAYPRGQKEAMWDRFKRLLLKQREE